MNLRSDIGAGDYDAVLAELSGSSGIGDDELAASLGLDALGFAQLGDDDQMAVLGAARQIIARKALSPAQVQAMIAQAVAKANPSGFGLLANNAASPAGAFGMKGSLNLLSFTGTVTGGGTLSVQQNLDRKSTIRELRIETASTPLRITSFSAAGLPFGALRFPFSASSFGPNVQDRSVRAQTYDASVTFSLTVSNPTGASIDMLIEAWGTPS